MGTATTWTQILSVIKLVAPWVSGGLAGAILTLIIKARESRRKRKILTIDIRSNSFSIPRMKYESELNPDDLSITYKGNQYKDLLLYRAVIQNTGHGIISDPRIYFVFPGGTNIVEIEVTSTPLKLEYKTDKKETEQGIEYSLLLEKVEGPDEITVSFLLDCPDPTSIKCLPRGLENVLCRIGETVYENELNSRVRLLIGYLSLFVLCGTIPILGQALKAFVILFTIPHVLYVIKFIRYRNVDPKQIISIENIAVDQDGILSIGHNTK